MVNTVKQWTCVLYHVVITWQSNPPISQFNSPCNEFTSVWSLCVYNITMWHTASSKLQTKHDEISNSLQKEHLIEVVSVISWNTDVSTDTIVIATIYISLFICVYQAYIHWRVSILPQVDFVFTEEAILSKQSFGCSCAIQHMYFMHASQ